MNIIYIHRTRGQGVEGVHINEIVSQFIRLGHRVEMVSPDNQAVKGIDNETATNKFNFSKAIPELLFEFIELAYNLVGYWKLAKLFNVFGGDLIYERYAIFSVFSTFFAKRKGITIVIEANYTSDLPLVRERSSILKPLAKTMDRYIFRNASRIIAVSNFLKQHLIKVYGVDASKIMVLPNAADPEKFKFVEYDPQSETKVIGFVGGFYPWHGLELLICAFAELIGDYPDTRLCLVGDGPERPTIEALAEKLGVARAINFVGKVDHDKLADLISEFYVGVMPDSNFYGSPMKIFEYMSMGVPVIAPDYPPILDAIENGEQGLIFEKQSGIDLIRCLKQVLESGEFRHRLSVEARAKIESEHNWQNNALLSIQGLAVS